MVKLELTLGKVYHIWASLCRFSKDKRRAKLLKAVKAEEIIVKIEESDNKELKARFYDTKGNPHKKINSEFHGYCCDRWNSYYGISSNGVSVTIDFAYLTKNEAIDAWNSLIRDKIDHEQFLHEINDKYLKSLLL